jgi:hypothetical protein
VDVLKTVLDTVLDKVTWPVALVVLAIALALIFHRKLSELIERTTSIEIDPGKRRWRVEFGQRVQHEQQKAAAIQRQITGRSPIPVSPPPAPPGNGSRQTGREIVLEAWGALRQAVYDGCTANGIPLTPTTGVREAFPRLRDARALDLDLARLVEFAYDQGREIASDRGHRPHPEDARAYANLAHSAAQLLALSVFTPLTPLPSPPPEALPRRATMVGGSFVPPSLGNASAELVAVAGPMKGQHYLIDKSNYRLGRNPNNDLCAAADASVSGEHACLRYQNGGLFLYDQDSRNGTFLNEQRITGTPVMVRHGDRIRLGESAFEVVPMSDTPPRGAKEEGRKGPDRSVVR